jgi:proton glutamate symport protein
VSKLKLHWQILIAIAAAVVVGLISSPDTTILGLSLVGVYDFVGTMFLRALQMLIVPLIMSSIISGVAGLGSGSDLGRLGLKTAIYYIATSLMAIMLGLVVVNLVAPGIIDGQPAGEILGLEESTEEVVSQVEGRGAGDLADLFQRMIPINIVGAAAQGEMLGLIFFSILFGYFVNFIPGPLSTTITHFANGIFETMMRITMWVMKFTPLGVFGLVAEEVTQTGFDAFRPLLAFFFTALFSLLGHALITLPLLLYLIARVNPWRHYRAMSPAMLTAFSTASSSATLPLTMECVEKNAGVSNRTTSFVLPLGATVNMDGTALYECVAAMFLAQAYGLQLGLVDQFTVVFVALVTSIGVAGIPAASLVAITIILTTIGLPVEAIGLILVTDRILDMVRTAINVFSDSCGAVIIAKTEGEKGILTDPHRTLRHPLQPEERGP